MYRGNICYDNEYAPTPITCVNGCRLKQIIIEIGRIPRFILGLLIVAVYPVFHQLCFLQEVVIPI